MNINNLSTSILQYKNLLKNTTSQFNTSNLLPLTQDTISFGAKSINDVNINQAKKTIAEFQKPEFNASSQRNITLGELLNACKYCGCTIEIDGGAHPYHIRTPLGQSHPIAIHSSIKNTKQIADPALANEVITAVKNLDDNNGEIIFNQEREDVIVTKDSPIIHTEQKNYYKEELLAKREIERKEKESQEAIKQAKQEKISDKETNEKRTIISGIKKKIDYLNTMAESYNFLYDSAVELLRQGFEAFDKTETLEKEKEELQRNIEKQLKTETDKKTDEIKEITENISYSEKDSKETLQAISDELEKCITVVDEEFKQQDESVYKAISENIHISRFESKYKGLTAIEELYRKAQAVRKEFKQLTKECSSKYTETSKSIIQKRDSINDLKAALIKDEITVEDSKRIAKEIVDSIDIEFIEFIDTFNANEKTKAANINNSSEIAIEKLITGIGSNIADCQSKLARIYTLLEEIKPNCEESKYEELKKKADAITSKLKKGKMQKFLDKLQKETVSQYIIAKKETTANDEYKSISKSLDKLTEEITILLPAEETTENITDTNNSVEEIKEEVTSETTEAISSEHEVQEPELTKENEVIASNEPKEDMAEVPEEIFEILSSRMLEVEKNNAQKPTETDLPEQKTEESAAEEIVRPVAENEAKTEDVNSSAISEETPAKEITPEVQKPQQIEETKNTAEVKTPTPHKISEAEDKNAAFADNLINTVARKMAMFNMIPLVEDLKSEIAGLFTEEEIDELKQSSAEKYWGLMTSKVNEISQNKNIKEIKRARTFAILKDIELTNPYIADEIYTKQESEINTIIKTISKSGYYKSYKPRMKNLNTIYSTYNKTPLNREKTVKFLSECFDMSEKDKKNLDSVINGNLSYINEITSVQTSKGLRTLIIKAVMRDYDAAYKTNYSSKSDKAIDNYNNKKLDEEKIKMLDKFDWNEDSLF